MCTLKAAAEVYGKAIQEAMRAVTIFNHVVRSLQRNQPKRTQAQRLMCQIFNSKSNGAR